MAGLMALLTILTSVPGRLAGRQLMLELQATAAGLEKAVVGVWVPSPWAISQLLDLVKQGAGQPHAGLPHADTIHVSCSSMPAAHQLMAHAFLPFLVSNT